MGSVVVGTPTILCLGIYFFIWVHYSGVANTYSFVDCIAVHCSGAGKIDDRIMKTLDIFYLFCCCGVDTTNNIAANPESVLLKPTLKWNAGAGLLGRNS